MRPQTLRPGPCSSGFRRRAASIKEQCLGFGSKHLPRQAFDAKTNCEICSDSCGRWSEETTERSFPSTEPRTEFDDVQSVPNEKSHSPTNVELWPDAVCTPESNFRNGFGRQFLERQDGVHSEGRLRTIGSWNQPVVSDLRTKDDVVHRLNVHTYRRRVL